MKRIFVVTDIHSCYTPLKQLLEYVKFNATDTLIINGDLFDRGYEIEQTFNFLVSNKDNIVYLKGNHEELVELYSKGNMSWMVAGGMGTLGFLNSGVNTSLQGYLNLIQTLPKEYIFKDFLITHAWINDLWDRKHTEDIIKNKLYNGTVNMVVGHSPVNLILNKDMRDIVNCNDFIVKGESNYFIDLDFGTYATNIMGMVELTSETIYINISGDVIVKQLGDIT